MNKLYPEIESYLNTLQRNAPLPEMRQKILRGIAEYISHKHEKSEVAELVFICTHNSRRSHFAQIWAAVAAHYQGIQNILTFSGGTEVTAFHPNAIAALERAGLQIDQPGGKNPVYLLKFSDTHQGVQAFSKKYSDKFNPSKRFCAVITCAATDAACPLVIGMDQRISIAYDDPQESDGKPDEETGYDARSRQIAIEMFYMMGQVNAQNLR